MAGSKFISVLLSVATVPRATIGNSPLEPDAASGRTMPTSDVRRANHAATATGLEGGLLEPLWHVVRPSQAKFNALNGADQNHQFAESGRPMHRRRNGRLNGDAIA